MRWEARRTCGTRSTGSAPQGSTWGWQGSSTRPRRATTGARSSEPGCRSVPTRADLERLGFFVCEADLEDELIRALGPARVEAIIEANGELSTFRTLQRQPAQRGRPIEAQLRRFMGTRSGRKEAYAAYLVEALDLADMPRPLDLVLQRVAT